MKTLDLLVGWAKRIRRAGKNFDLRERKYYSRVQQYILRTLSIMEKCKIHRNFIVFPQLIQIFESAAVYDIWDKNSSFPSHNFIKMLTRLTYLSASSLKLS